MTRTRTTLPLEAHDSRLFDFWRRGSLTRIILGSVPDGLPYHEYLTRSGQLVRLNQMMNAARAAAKRERMSGWEDLYRAVIRQRRDDKGRIVQLTLEPRGTELDAILGAAPPVTVPLPETAPTEAPEVVSDDLLTDLFGKPTEEVATEGGPLAP